MLLFKKVSFLPLRIGLNLMLYGVGGTFALSMIVFALPENVTDNEKGAFILEQLQSLIP